MARYVVQRKHEQACTRYTRYEMELEVAPGADVDQVMRGLPSRTWGDSVDDWYEDEHGVGDSYEVMECLEDDSGNTPVQGTPEDQGLAQPTLALWPEGEA
jgi:hypothetical protein